MRWIFNNKCCMFQSVYSKIHIHLSKEWGWSLESNRLDHVKIPIISETTYSYSFFLWLKMVAFLLIFSWKCLFPRFQLTKRSPLVLAMGWYRSGAKPLPDPMMTQFTDSYLGLPGLKLVHLSNFINVTYDWNGHIWWGDPTDDNSVAYLAAYPQCVARKFQTINRHSYSYKSMKEILSVMHASMKD